MEISRGWEFVRRKADSDWRNGGGGGGEPVDLPHCWNTTDTFQRGVDYHRGWGSYRRRIIVDQAGAWRLVTEGFYGTGTLWLNGKAVARFSGQYLGLDEEVTLEAGEHVVALHLTNRCPLTELPGIRMPDFLLYGGLAGRAWLRRGSEGRTPDIRAALSESGEGVVRIRHADGGRLFDADGNGVGEGTEIKVAGPRLWSPDDPSLYRLDCAGSEYRIGFRDAVFTTDGFLLNGARTPLRGLNRHESMPGFGNALPLRRHREDAEMLKACGCNLVRLSHYPQHPAFLDACDELGILVYAEIATWKSVRGGRWLKNALRQMRGMIERDRHRPSVILWGLGNESRTRKPYIALRDLVRSLDDRPTIYAENHLHRALRRKTTDLCDVYGLNYEIDKFEAVFQAGGQRPVLVSEMASHRAIPGDWDVELEQLADMKRWFEAVERHPFVAGFTMWCFADYATLRKERYTRYSGVVDAWRTPKPACDYLKALFGKDPFVRLYGQWNEAGGKGPRKVLVLSSAPRTVLRRNGEVVGQFEGRGYHVIDLDFEPGRLTAEGEGCEDTLASWTQPAAIEAECVAEGVVDVRVVDDRGAWVADWAGPLRVEAAGPVEVMFHSPEPVVEARRGLGRIFYRRTARDGEIRFTVRAGSGRKRGVDLAHCSLPHIDGVPCQRCPVSSTVVISVD